MDWLARHLGLFAKPKLLIAVGAGRGRDIPALNRRPAERLVLLEPQARLADNLRLQTTRMTHAQVLEYALHGESGTDNLVVFNFPELNSLEPDPSFISLLPGVVQTALVPVETRSLEALVQELDVQASPDNWLILDVYGLDPQVLEGLADPTLGGRFGHIILRTRQEPEGTASDGVLRSLSVLGFQPIGEWDRSDGDWPRVHLQRHEPSERQTELEARIDGMEQRARQLAEEKAGLEAQLEESAATFKARSEALEQQLRDSNQTAESRLAELEKLKSQKAGDETRVQELTDLVEALNTTTEASQDRIRRLELNLEQAQTDLSVALRRQGMRENDLEELRERYAAVVENRNAQHELLSKIRKRLGLAAGYLQQLEHESDSERKSELTSGLVRALAQDSVEDA